MLLVWPFHRRNNSGGTNPVPYPDQSTADDLFEVHDPDGLLPHNRASWRNP